jgi:hypothetical protein
MSNPWGVKLKPTGLNEERLSADKSSKLALEERQSSLTGLASENISKMKEYEDRQSELPAKARTGQQGRLPGQGGKKKSRRHRKTSRRHKKSKKTRKQRKRRY